MYHELRRNTFDDHRPHKSHKVPADLSHFWMVTVLTNSPRYKRRYELYYPFAQMCKDAGVNLVTVEVAFGHRQHMITEHGNPNHVQLRSHEELWHKENMGNIAVQRASYLDPLIREVAFSDCDLRPMSHPRDWFEETWHALQHYEAVQMFEYLVNLDTEGNPLDAHAPSFMGSYMKYGLEAYYHGRHHHKHHRHHHKPIPHSGGRFWMGAPGGAWAWNIEAFKAVGGLLDICILGSADWHMAQGLLGILEPMEQEKWSKPYSEKLFAWQERALRWIKKDVGVVKGGMLHDNHGPKVQRYYVPRKQIIVESQFDPNKDIKMDHQGLWQLETWDDRQINLRDNVREYFAMRREDTPEFKT